MLRSPPPLRALGPALLIAFFTSPAAAKPAVRTSTHGPALNYFALLSEQDFAQELAKRHRTARSWPELLESVSRGLVAGPYLLSPLGEGEGVDPDPRFRLDAFDCTTFVETVLALAACDNPTEAAALLDRIRYHGLPSFQSRSHLIEAQWIPSLVEQGFVEDVTEELGGDAVRYVDVVITKRSWKTRRIGRDLALDTPPIGKHRLPMIPIAKMVSDPPSLPPGTIVNIVREEVPWSPTMIAHQGIVLAAPRTGVAIVRHASPVSKRVIDETVEHMMGRYLKPKREKKWKIAGVNLLRIVPLGMEADAPLARQ